MAKIISIFSTKGGVGRTFIAANLAVSLANTQTKKVLLLDADFQSPGDIARIINVSPNKALADFATSWKSDRYDNYALQEHILRFRSGRIDFLPVVLSSPEGVQIEGDFICRVFEDLNKEYEFIIIDAGRSFTKSLIHIFEQTNLILFVVNPDILSVYQAKDAAASLEALYFPLRMMKALLNRSESQGGVSWREVRSALPCDIIARIPSEGRVVGTALNRRMPVVLDNPRCRASLAFNKLSEDLIHHPEYFISHHELSNIFAAYPQRVEKRMLDELPSFSLEGLTLSGRRIEGEKKQTREDKIDDLKLRIHKRLIQELDLRRMDQITLTTGTDKIKDLRQKTMVAINNFLSEEAGGLISIREERERLIKEITDEALGLGPLEDLIDDQEITDIMVNNKNQIYIEKQGKVKLVSKRFASNEQVRQVVERIIAPLGRRIDESVPMVDARLADGSRVNAIIPPLSLTGPTLTIRKFGRERLNIPDLVRLKALNNAMGDFLKACVLARKNIIVSGGTGSGKTTILNVLSEFIPDGERIITIEDAAELKLHHEHWVRLESRPSNIEGRGAISVRELFRNSLRMRPDRVIIGECRGQETLDMLQAMNSGHDGSMTTLHANSTRDVLSRMDSLILMSGIEIPLRAIREMIASAINIIVHTARLADGSRKITQITEVTGMLDEMHIGLQDIFTFSQIDVDEQGKIIGEFLPTGALPSFLGIIKKRGIFLSEDIFKAK